MEWSLFFGIADGLYHRLTILYRSENYFIGFEYCVSKTWDFQIKQYELTISEGIILLLSDMFPTPTRDIKQNLFNPSFSPSDRAQPNRFTQLPYFKRFPNSKFLSQQRKRLQKFDVRQLSHPSVSPANRNFNRPSFFKNSQPALRQVSPKISENQKAASSSILKVSKDSKNRKLYKQVYERQGTKMRQNTDCSHDYHRTSIHHNKNQNILKNNGDGKLTPVQLLKAPNNLQSYQKQQLVSYTQVYYYGQNCLQKKSTLGELTKTDGAYNWVKGDQIHFRYQILDLLGEGSFGQVFKCMDHKRGKPVALKIVKNNQKYTNQARTEIKLLNFIKVKDPTGTKNCVHIKDFFQFRDRMCMTFDLMSINLYELIKSNGYYGLPLDLIRRMSLQILNAIHFLHKNQIIHADLKPENILLKEQNKSGVKVIDFGSSCFEKQTIYTYIQSRYYRAPEVILGIPYNRKIDVWSFACIIAELHLGYPLFAGDQQHEQMCLIIEVLGSPPLTMLQAAKRTEVFFDKHYQLKNHPKKMPEASKSLQAALQNPQDQDFVDFIKLCLQWVPEIRCQALDCLKHKWILKGLPQQIKQQHLKFIAEEQQRKTNQNYQKSRSFSLNHQRHKLFH